MAWKSSVRLTISGRPSPLISAKVRFVIFVPLFSLIPPPLPCKVNPDFLMLFPDSFFIKATVPDRFTPSPSVSHKCESMPAGFSSPKPPHGVVYCTPEGPTGSGNPSPFKSIKSVSTLYVPHECDRLTNTAPPEIQFCMDVELFHSLFSFLPRFSSENGMALS